MHYILGLQTGENRIHMQERTCIARGKTRQQHTLILFRSIMQLRTFLVGCVLLAYAALASSDWQKRQAPMNEQVSISEQSKTDPVGAARRVRSIPGLLKKHQHLWATNSSVNNVSGTGDNWQVPWARGAWFNFNPVAIGTSELGYLSIPHAFHGFVLNRTFEVRNGNATVVAPFYEKLLKDKTKFKRAVIAWPGKWRDSWRFINMLENAYRVGAKYPELCMPPREEVFMISPLFMNELDRVAMHSREALYKSSQWSAGGTVREPKEGKGLSSFEVMDQFIDMLFDKSQFPNIEKIVIVGHSMGAQAALHYSILRKYNEQQDCSMRFWIGDPGSYTFFDSERSNSTAHCKSYNNWPYGISRHTIPKYARHRAGHRGKTLIEGFRRRKIDFALALNDNGPGVKNCQARAQGPNRLARATDFIIRQGESSEGWPKDHTVNFVPGFSHQDYPMMSELRNLHSIFVA